MQQEDLESFFDSFIYNGVQLIADRSLQTKLWVTCEGPEIGDFDDDMGIVLEFSEVLIANQSKLDINRIKYLPLIQKIHDLVKLFYRNVVNKSLYLEVEELINKEEWLEIVHFASSFHSKLMEEPWWNKNIIH
ncbi:MAG: hypothetical protein LW832_02225 [Parachlamydia sp.]|jgi:hypothetical protein|nr:hypothetical protein [Parachlamydia sp.]